MKNMSSGIESRVFVNVKNSTYFISHEGRLTRQGENLSLFLFSLFIKDIDEFVFVNYLKFKENSRKCTELAPLINSIVC